jgi:hypothetical protein
VDAQLYLAEADADGIRAGIVYGPNILREVIVGVDETSGSRHVFDRLTGDLLAIAKRDEPWPMAELVEAIRNR